LSEISSVTLTVQNVSGSTTITQDNSHNQAPTELERCQIIKHCEL